MKKERVVMASHRSDILTQNLTLWGIASHVAVEPREMRKPCVIGTRNATVLLYGGDLVEVNAYKEVVKIIKRADA